MKKSLEKRDLGLLFYIWIITSLLIAFTISCNALDRDGNITWTTSRVLWTIFLSLGASALITGLCFFALSWLKEHPQKIVLYAENTTGKLPVWTWISFPLVFMGWFPAFLAFYPALCSYDAEGFFFQFVYDAFNNHHPIAYTLLVEFFYNLGNNLFGSYTVGIALFTLVQMLLLAFSISFFLRAIYRAYSKKWLFFSLTALFALLPVNAYMSVTTTKDIYFASGMLFAFTALFSRLFLQESNLEKWKNDFFFVLGLIMIALFRSNGRYCILATLIIQLFCIIKYKNERKKILRMLINTVIAFALGMVLLSALDKITNSQEVDKREMFSLPAQQIARVVHFHEEELSEETMQQIQTVIWPSSLYLYNQRTARFVKQDVISYEILHYPTKYLKLYMQLLGEYPGDYVNAFLGLYSGFLNPWDKSHIRINEGTDGVLPDDFHYIQTAFTVTDRFMIDHTPLSETLHELYRWYANNDIYTKVPILSLLSVPGSYLWILLYCFGILVYQKKGICCIPCALVFSYYLTFFLGPTVQLRYIFPIMLCTPGIVLLTLIKMRRDKNETNNSNSML